MKSESSTNSMVSRTSTSSASEGSKNTVYNVEVNSFDVFFPLYDKLCKEIKLPYIITAIPFCIMLLQSLLQSFWAVKFGFVVTDNFIGKITRYLIYIFLWYDPQNSQKMNIILGIVIISVFVLSTFILILFFFTYRNKVAIHKFGLYFYKILVEVFIPMLVLPSITFSGQAIVDLINQRSKTAETVIGMICIFASLLFLALCTNHFMLINKSPCLPKSYFITFFADYTNKYIRWCFVAECLAFIVSVFPAWATSVLALLYIFVHIYLLVLSCKQPFIRIHPNSAFTAASVAIIVNSIIQAIQGSVKVFYGSTVLFTTIAVFVITWIITFYIFKAQRRKIAALLNEDKIQEPLETNDAKFDYLDSLGFYRDFNKLLLYVVVAIESSSQFYINGLLIRYLQDFCINEEASAVITLVSSLIPMHSRHLNSTFSRLAKRRGLSFSNRFLCYSLARLKIYRQSASSAILLDSLAKLKIESKRCLEIIKGFWVSTPKTISSFQTYRSAIKKTENRFIDFINNFPNSSAGYAEYATFLIESKMNFTSAALQHHKFTLLEEGRSFTKDIPYRSFIAQFPHYLKRGIIDFKGNAIAKHRSGTSSSSRGLNASSSSLSLDMVNEIAPEDEENAARVLFTNHKIRLAFQRATETQIPRYSTCFKESIAVITVLSIAALIIIDLLFSNYYDKRVTTVKEIKYLNDARYFMSLSRLAMTLELAKKEGKFAIDDAFRAIISKDVGLNHYIQLDSDLILQVLELQSKGNINFNNFINTIVEDAIQGDEVYKVDKVILSQEVNISLCDTDGVPMPDTGMTSLKALYSFLSVVIVTLTKDQPTMWENSAFYCDIIVNLHSIADVYEVFYDSAMKHEKKAVEEQGIILRKIDITAPIVLFAINAITLSTILALIIREFRTVLNLIHDAPQNAKELCLRPIAKAAADENSHSNIAGSAIFVQYYVILFLLIIVVPILLFVALYETVQKNNGFEKITDWMIIGSSRASLLSECIEHLSLAIMFSGDKSIHATTRDRELKLAESLNILVQEHHNSLVNGDQNIEPCVNFDEELDKIHFQVPCQSVNNETDIHERYRCISLSESFAFFSSFVKEVIAKIDTVETLNDAIILNLIHLLNTHMADKLIMFSRNLSSIAEHYESDFTTTFFAITLVGIFWTIFSFAILLIVSYNIDDLYHYATALLRRIPPSFITSNKALLDFILNRKQTQSKTSSSISHNVILSSPDAILFLSKAGIVEMVNESVTSILGYVPDQILGQNVAFLFQDNEIPSTLTLMRTGEAKDFYEAHTNCISDNAQHVPCLAMILAMKKEEVVDSFVMFIKDEAELIMKQKAAEEAKVISEELLYQILPRPIVNRLNQGEKDITFTVPVGSVMFIDIVKFSEYASNLTPQQIMTNLSTLFESFDKCLVKYETVTKIKLIGDIYMCASGLFTEDENPKVPAEEMLKLAMDCLGELETFNTQLEALLSVRIGINTGGPIIGGILGTDKPVFDIIGDPINVASRLQSTCIPNRVQISLETYEYVKSLEYSFEHRNDVFLKGKGNTETYIVSHFNQYLTVTDLTTSVLSITSHKMLQTQ